MTWVIHGTPTEFLRMMYQEKHHQHERKGTEIGKNEKRLSYFKIINAGYKLLELLGCKHELPFKNKEE